MISIELADRLNINGIKNDDDVDLTIDTEFYSVYIAPIMILKS